MLYTGNVNSALGLPRSTVHVCHSAYIGVEPANDQFMRVHELLVNWFDTKILGIGKVRSSDVQLQEC